MAVMPQFPLGSVLFPSMVLPLHVFEPRYRALAHDLVREGGRFSEGDGAGEFGVVLIERGHEVGGDDQRTLVGTVATVAQHEEYDDGRWALITVGTRRIRISDWYPDAPYPLAEVEDWPDEPAGPNAEQRLSDVKSVFARTWALATEAGHDVGPLPELSDDPSVGSMQLATVAPIGVLDQQHLLEQTGPDTRLDRIEHHLREACEMFELEIRAD